MTSSGVYITPGSRGIIVYRTDVNKFKAYERQPPNDPFLCCNETKTVCGKLVVGGNFPFVKDTCNNNLYQLLDGSLFQGEGRSKEIGKSLLELVGKIRERLSKLEEASVSDN